MGEDGQTLVADRKLKNLSYVKSPLDGAILFLFRKLVAIHTRDVRSDALDIKGLLVQGRRCMAQGLPGNNQFYK